MALGIISRVFQTQTRGAVDLSLLQACIGERIKVITELYFDNILIPDIASDNTAYYAPTTDVSGRWYNADLIWFENTEFLANAQIGDSFLSDNNGTTLNPNLTFILLEKINPNLGRFNLTFVHQQMGGAGGQFIANITALKSLVYQYGINESGEFTSQTDGSLQKSTLDDDAALTLAASTLLNPLGNNDWQIDSITLLGTGFDNVNYPAGSHAKIKLTHEVVVTPLFLVGQLEDLAAGIPPDYFKPDNLIKYISQIDWNKNNTFLDPGKSILPDATGRFGWFNKRFDGVASDYSITSLTLQRISDSEFVNQLEYGEIEVKINVNSAAGNFSAVNSRLVFGFNYLPQDAALYQNTDRALDVNFAFDSKLLTPDNITVNGDNSGTDLQVIKTIGAEVIDPNNCLITVRILFGADRVDILTQEDVANYAMWVICENTNLDVQLCDKTNLLIQVDEIYEQLTTVDLIDDVTEFIEHPYDLVGAGFPTLEMFPVDDVVANSLLSIDFTGLEDNGILLKSCKCQLVLKHATEADIVLDSFTINLENFPTVGLLPAVQAIDFSQQRPYKIEDGIRKLITFNRNFAFDAGLIKYYNVSFPFMNRWEYWLKIAGVTNLPSSLFDSTEDFNGANHFWDRLVNTTGWSLVYRKTFQIIQNEETFEQEFDNVLTSTDFESNPDWTSCSIKTYDLDTDDEVVVGPKKYAYSSKDTKVIASFTKSVGIVPDIANIAIVIWGESREGGGITEITRISSVHEVISDSIFESVDDTDLVKVTKTGDVFTGEAIIRGDKIQNLSRLTLYARIYYPVDDLGESARITNDLILRAANDGQIRII
jgi:hypothetical protein